MILILILTKGVWSQWLGWCMVRHRVGYAGLPGASGWVGVWSGTEWAMLGYLQFEQLVGGGLVCLQRRPSALQLCDLLLKVSQVVLCVADHLGTTDPLISSS